MKSRRSVPPLGSADEPVSTGCVVARSSSQVPRLAALAVLLSSGLGGQVTQFNVQHSIPPNTLKSATGTNLIILPGALGYDYFNGSAVERRIFMPWSTNHDYMPGDSNWAVSTNGGRTFGATGGSQVITSADGYVNRSITSRAGTFSVEFYATPSLTTSTMTVSLCQGAQSADTGLACSVRFNPSGFIDARNGGAWSAAASVPYAANTGYYFRLDANLTAHTYTIYVRPPSTPPGDPNTLLGSNYAFRTEQGGVTALDNFNYHVSGSGSVTVSTTAMGTRALIKQRTTGALLAYNFGWVGPQPTNHSFNFPYYKSTDGGSTWTDHNAVVDFGAIVCNSMHFHRDILEENDGSLYAIGYAHFPAYDQAAPPGFWRVVMIKSTDGGANWSYLSTIASSSIRDYTESTFARCLDGTWLCIMKATGADNYLRYMRTATQGASWTGGAAQLPGLTSAFGVDPALNLLPNGTLALSWGPDNAQGASRDLHVAISADGCGNNWSMERTVFTSTLWAPGQHNFPEAGYDDVYEASGYSAIPYTGAHRLLHLSDTGHSWSYNNTVPNPNPYSVRGRAIDVVRTNEINRIDLKTKLAVGAAAITADSDLTYTEPNNQESRASAAVDGSTAYWSGAFKNGTSGHWTIDLQQTCVLNKIGVCLHYNTSQAATIKYSLDNATWTTIKTYTPDGVNFDAAHGTQRALDYTSFGPLSARYVRVDVSNSATANVCLNEIELYTTTDTFENNALGDPGVPHGILPPGYVANGTSGSQYGFAVRDSGTSAAGYQSERSLQLWDGSSTWRAGIKKTVTPATTSKTLEFRVKPLAYAPTSGAIQFTIGSGATTVFQIAVFSDGSLNRWDGSAWHAMAGAGTVPLSTWSLIQITASASTGSASVSVNGVSKGSAAKISGVSASTLNCFGFGSGGTAPSGDNALFDDISFQ